MDVSETMGISKSQQWDVGFMSQVVTYWLCCSFLLENCSVCFISWAHLPEACSITNLFPTTIMWAVVEVDNTAKLLCSNKNGKLKLNAGCWSVLTTLPTMHFPQCTVFSAKWCYAHTGYQWVLCGFWQPNIFNWLIFLFQICNIKHSEPNAENYKNIHTNKLCQK